MKSQIWIAGIWLAVGACLPVGISLAAGIPQAETTTTSDHEARAQFKKATAKFLQSAQAYLGVTTLQWQNYMMAPRPGAVSEITTNNAGYKAQIAAEFDALISLPGGNEAVVSRLKDYYAAWGLAFDSMRPTSADGARGFPARTNAEMQRMDAMAARIKMDL